MVTKFNFGKIDYYKIGKKNCAVELEFGFREFDGQEPYFSVCGKVWNHIKTGCVIGGQCLDYLFNNFKSLRHNPLFNECYTLWHAYHLKPKSKLPAEVVKEIEDILKHGNERNIFIKY